MFYSYPSYVPCVELVKLYAEGKISGSTFDTKRGGKPSLRIQWPFEVPEEYAEIEKEYLEKVGLELHSPLGDHVFVTAYCVDHWRFLRNQEIARKRLQNSTMTSWAIS